MRWTRPEFRIIKRFALFPIEMNDETRWLEIVYIKQHYRDGGLLGLVGWWNLCFATREEYLEYKSHKNKEKGNG